MWLIREIASFVRWTLSVSRKFFIIAPSAMSIVILATLLSQISRLLAFLLPLKIVLLIGSTGVPRYFPPFLLGFDRDKLVVCLGIATVAFFISHLVAEKLVDNFTERTADRLLARSNKLFLVKNQSDVARRTCRRFAEMIAALIFVGLSVSVLSFVHASVAIMLVALATGWLIATAFAGWVSQRFRDWLETNATGYTTLATAIAFFAVTGLIIAEFVSGFDLQILIAIISIILSRQALSRITAIIGNAIALHARKPLINTLFFHGVLWNGTAVNTRATVWDLLKPAQLPGWLPNLLEQVTEQQVQTATITGWHQTGITDILVLDVGAQLSDGESRNFLVKLYGRGKDLPAAHETTLLTQCGSEILPAPHFHGTLDLKGDIIALVYDPVTKYADDAPDAGSNAEQSEDDDDEENPDAEMASDTETESATLLPNKQEAFAQCWAVDLPPALMSRYTRTHRQLDRKLKDAPWDRLELVAFDAQARRNIDGFRQILDSLCAWLETVPRALYNPAARSPFLHTDATGRAVVIHWGQWIIEPIGAGWPVKQCDDENVEAVLMRARSLQPALEAVSASDIALVARLFALEKAVRKQAMSSAMALLPNILERAAEHGIQAPGFVLPPPGKTRRKLKAEREAEQACRAERKESRAGRRAKRAEKKAERAKSKEARASRANEAAK